MPRKNRPVAIVGVGQTRHSSHREDVNQPEMVHEAVRAALDDAGLTLADVDAVVTGNMEMFEGIHQPDMWQVLGNGAWGKPCLRVSTGGTTGATVFCAADNLVASGLHDVVLAIGFEKQQEGHTTGGITAMADPLWARHLQTGALTGMAALEVIRGVRCRAGAPRGDEVPRHHGHARGPQRQRASVLPPVVRHDRRADEKVAPLGGRAAADPHVLAVGRRGGPDLRVAGSGPLRCGDRRCGCRIMSRSTARRQWRSTACARGAPAAASRSPRSVTPRKSSSRGTASRVPREEIDVFEMYDPSAWWGLSWIRDFLLLDGDEHLRMVERGDILIDGSFPINPSGGVTATNPIGATALLRPLEAALQVRGDAGDHQVPRERAARPWPPASAAPCGPC